MYEVICIFFPNSLPSSLFESFAESCYRFSSQIALRKHEAIFLEINKSKLLFSKTTLISRIKILAKRYNLNIQIAFSKNPKQALALARFNCDYAKLPLDALLDYANPFEIDSSQEKQILKIINLLQKLGIVFLKDFFEIPISQLGKRFGLTTAQIRENIITPPPYWPLFHPKQIISETINCADVHINRDFLEPILFFIKQALDKVINRLFARNLKCSQLILKFSFEKTSLTKVFTREITFSFSLPQFSSVDILKIFRDRLTIDFQNQPLINAIEEIEIIVTQTSPGARAQFDLFKAQNNQDSFDSLIARLSTKLGENNCFYAALTDRYLPEKSWEKSIQKQKLSLDQHPTPPRPTRILKTPMVLRKIDRCFISKSHVWKIHSAHGPEHLSGEWWLNPISQNGLFKKSQILGNDEYRTEVDSMSTERGTESLTTKMTLFQQAQGFDRQYYTCLTEGGEILWVYFNCLDSKFYLHGFFD